MPSRWFHILVGLWFWGMGIAPIQAQFSSFRVAVQTSPETVYPNTDVTFRFALTNLNLLTLTEVQMTVLLEGAGTYLSATNVWGPVSHAISANGLTNSVSYIIPIMTNSAGVDLSYRFRPNQPGMLRQTLLVQAVNALPYEAQIQTPVLAGKADLKMGFSSIPQGGLVGDHLAYVLSVTNAGVNPVVDVRLTNTLPAGIEFERTAPASLPSYQIATTTGTMTVLSLGTLQPGQVGAVEVQMQPKMASTWTLKATAGAVGYDPVSTDSGTATDFLTVSTPGMGDLAVELISPQVFDPQSGLMLQRARVRNQGTNSVMAIRVMASGLSQGLYNAAGTNGVLPFVTLRGPFLPGDEAELSLQYFHPSRQPASNPVLVALAVPTPGQVLPVGSAVSGTQIRRSPDGWVYLEFPTVTGRRYAVRYGEDARLGMGAVLPILTAPGSRMTWVDSGAPWTAPPASQARSRFYQVIEVTWP